MSTQTRVHSANEHKIGRKTQRLLRSGDDDGVVLQWLPKHLEYIPREFRKLVEEQNAIMGKADFSSTRRARTSSDEAGIGNRVVWRTEGTPGEQTRALRKQATNAMDLSRLDRFLKCERWQNSGQPLGE